MVNKSWIIFLGCMSVVLAQSSPKLYKIDLSIAPETRWIDVLTDKKAAILNLASTIEKFTSATSIWLAGQALSYSHNLQTLRRELVGAAEITHSDFNTLAYLNLIYPLEGDSSLSILARQADGTVLLGKNIEFHMKDLIKSLEVDVEFYKGKDYLYRTTMYAGYFGVLEGVRDGAFSVSVNKKESISEYLDWFYLYMGYLKPSHAVRNVLEYEKDYQSALLSLSGIKINTPAYFLISDAEKNGVVLTRSTDSTLDQWSLIDKTWYLVQTNFDHKLPAPDSDHGRAKAASALLDSITSSELSLEALQKILQDPRLLFEDTVVSTVANTKTGEYISLIIP